MATREEELAAKNMLGYSVGFALAVVLTIAAYFAVVGGWFTGAMLIGFIMALAVVQLLVQLVFFLHLGRNSGKWNIAAVLFTLMILVIIVAGSLRIMHNMNYNMHMTPEQMNEFMRKES